MQFWAILVDTWRLLCARKLFWVALVLTALVGVAYLSVGFYDDGLTLVSWKIENPWLARGTPGAESFYIEMFYRIVQLWTTLFGVILALISCSSIFPEMMAPGAIDVVVSKPIGRPRLFCYKYACAMIFAAVQAVLLAAIVLVAIRWRLGFWHLAVLWSVPLTVALFSYLYAVNVFVGVWTRSVLASLLLTLLFWPSIKVLQFGETFFGEISRTSAVKMMVRAGNAGKVDAPIHDESPRWPEMWRQILSTTMMVLPKTQETTELVQRLTLRESDRMAARDKYVDDQMKAHLQFEQMFKKDKETQVDRAEIRRQAEQDYEGLISLQKSPAYIIGTSLAFEAVVLALACWIFSRRDF